MFVFEHIKRKNFLNRKRKTQIDLETDITENEKLNLEKFKAEISNEIGTLKEKKEDQ